MTDQRLNLLKEWLHTILASPFDIETASSDASFRRYFRIRSNQTTFIAMDAPPEHENIVPFIDIAQKIYQTGVNAPFIHHQNLQHGFLLLSDLGSQDYLSNLNTQTANQYYNDAFSALLSMQQIKTSDLPYYDATLLKQEMDLFDEWFIQKHLQKNLNQTQQTILDNTQQLLIKSALEQPQVFVHRDYHSRNLMLTETNNPGVIDFQDAVIGPITYDLVSLLRDCYIRWPDEKVYEWVASYYTNLKLNISLDTFIRWFDLMGLQRHIKVLGIFIRLYYRDNKSGYLKDLPLTYQYTKMIAARYPELADFNTLLDDLDIENKLVELKI